MLMLRGRILRGMITLIAAFMFCLPLQSQAAEIEEPALDLGWSA